jgi:hypothetical protein
MYYNVNYGLFTLQRKITVCKAKCKAKSIMRYASGHLAGPYYIAPSKTGSLKALMQKLEWKTYNGDFNNI